MFILQIYLLNIKSFTLINKNFFVSEKSKVVFVPIKILIFYNFFSYLPKYTFYKYIYKMKNLLN